MSTYVIILKEKKPAKELLLKLREAQTPILNCDLVEPLNNVLDQDNSNFHTSEEVLANQSSFKNPYTQGDGVQSGDGSTEGNTYISCNTSSGAAGTCTIKTTFASGETALTETDLHPSGWIVINDERVFAVSEGNFIDKNVSVVILSVDGNRVVVRKK